MLDSTDWFRSYGSNLRKITVIGGVTVAGGVLGAAGGMSVVRELWEQMEFGEVLSDIWPPSQSDNCASVFLPVTGIFGVSPH